MGSELILGLCILGGIVGAQVLMRYRRARRMKGLLDAANEAIRSGNFEAAEQALRKGVRLIPLWVSGRIALGGVLVQLDRFGEAEEQLKLAAQLEPRQPAGHLHLGAFYATQFPDRQQDAESAFRRAVGCDPDLIETIQTDPQLRGLLDHPELRAILATMTAERTPAAPRA